MSSAGPMPPCLHDACWAAVRFRLLCELSELSELGGILAPSGSVC